MRPVVSCPPQHLQHKRVHHAQPYPPILPVKIEGSGGGKAGFSITFVHLGRKLYQMTLWMATHTIHRTWIENITRQQDLMRERSHLYVLSEGIFQSANCANCAAPFSE